MGIRTVTGHSPASAIEAAETAVRLVSNGDSTTEFSGRVLKWDTGKSDSVSLQIPCSWAADCVMQLNVWATRPVDLEIIVGGRSAPAKVALAGAINGKQHHATPEIALNALGVRYESHAQATCSVRPAGGGGGAVVYFGLSPDSAGNRTAIREAFRWSTRTAVLGATWIAAFFGLVALAGTLYSYWAIGLLALPFVPELLKYFGFSSAFKINVSVLAFWLHGFCCTRRWSSRVLAWLGAVLSRRSSSRVFSWLGAVSVGLSRRSSSRVFAWLGTVPVGLSSAVLFLMGVYVAHSLLAPQWFRHRLEDTLDISLRTNAANLEEVTLFCDYPGRIESRALLARRLDEIRNDLNAWQVAQRAILERVPAERFIDNCTWPWWPWTIVQTNIDERHDEARVFYASLVFNSLSGDPKDFPTALAVIRRVLGSSHGGPPGPLSDLALTMYELKSHKNTSEDVECARDRNSPGCTQARQKCQALRQELEKKLAASTFTKPNLRQQVTYIEAHDLAATSALSFACSTISSADVASAIRHYDTMLGAMPADARLDRGLSQINLRNLVAAQLDDPAVLDQVPASWREACKNDLKTACDQIHTALIGKGDLRYFLKDRKARNNEWDRACLPLLSMKEFRETLLVQSTRNWRNPW